MGFVLASIPNTQEAQDAILLASVPHKATIKIGNRILLLSPHPGQVKAELNSLPRDAARTDPEGLQALERRIHTMLFADAIEEEHAHE